MPSLYAEEGTIFLLKKKGHEKELKPNQEALLSSPQFTILPPYILSCHIPAWLYTASDLTIKTQDSLVFLSLPYENSCVV